jgi:hypothetical protein
MRPVSIILSAEVDQQAMRECVCNDIFSKTFKPSKLLSQPTPTLGRPEKTPGIVGVTKLLRVNDEAKVFGLCLLASLITSLNLFQSVYLCIYFKGLNSEGQFRKARGKGPRRDPLALLSLSHFVYVFYNGNIKYI